MTLPCPECGPVVLPTSDVAVACIGDVAEEVSYECPTCRVRRSLAASTESLSLLHRAGVRAVALGPDDDRDDEREVDTARQVVSLRVLLDQPDFLSRMESTIEQAEPIAPPGQRHLSRSPGHPPVPPMS